MLMNLCEVYVSILKIPQDMKRLRIVTADQVAFVMAGNGSWPCFEDIEQFSEAANFKEVILQAVKFKEITPLTASKKSSWGDSSEVWYQAIDIETIDQSSLIHNATFLASEIWPWAEKELSDSSPWYAFSPVNAPVPSPTNLPANRDMPSTLRKKFSPDSASLLLIAGLVRVLEGKHKGVYTWNGINKNKMAQDAAEAISGFMDKYTKDKTESFRKLIAEALQRFPENPED
ncbi:hypothetical protein [Serratia fonticola]|uniref:hypothetical protein n=1 Tax=Serratia fonticola TaxID=47917 RepID=UPI0020C773E9|nr:hypothetical protein [Serratia fonticola]